MLLWLSLAARKRPTQGVVCRFWHARPPSWWPDSVKSSMCRVWRTKHRPRSSSFGEGIVAGKAQARLGWARGVLETFHANRQTPGWSVLQRSGVPATLARLGAELARFHHGRSSCRAASSEAPELNVTPEHRLVLSIATPLRRGRPKGDRFCEKLLSLGSTGSASWASRSADFCTRLPPTVSSVEQKPAFPNITTGLTALCSDHTFLPRQRLLHLFKAVPGDWEITTPPELAALRKKPWLCGRKVPVRRHRRGSPDAKLTTPSVNLEEVGGSMGRARVPVSFRREESKRAERTLVRFLGACVGLHCPAFWKSFRRASFTGALWSFMRAGVSFCLWRFIFGRQNGISRRFMRRYYRCTMPSAVEKGIRLSDGRLKWGHCFPPSVTTGLPKSGRKKTNDKRKDEGHKKAMEHKKKQVNTYGKRKI